MTKWYAINGALRKSRFFLEQMCNFVLKFACRLRIHAAAWGGHGQHSAIHCTQYCAAPIQASSHVSTHCTIVITRSFFGYHVLVSEVFPCLARDYSCCGFRLNVGINLELHCYCVYGYTALGNLHAAPSPTSPRKLVQTSVASYVAVNSDPNVRCAPRRSEC